MELLKKSDPVKYTYNDMVFSVRKDVTVGDKYALDMAGELQPDGTSRFSIRDYCSTLVRLFVVGWSGVTQDGKEVPWSYDTFMNSFPMDADGKDLVIDLGLWIAEATGIKKQQVALKNG